MYIFILILLIYTYIHICMCMYMCMYIYTCMHIYIYGYTCIHVCIRIQICTGGGAAAPDQHVYICIYINIYIICIYICIYINLLIYIHRRTRAVRFGGGAAAPDRRLRAAGGRIQGNSRVWCQVRQGAPACPHSLQRPKSLRCPSRLILVHSRELPLLMQHKASSLWHQREIPF